MQYATYPTKSCLISKLPSGILQSERIGHTWSKMPSLSLHLVAVCMQSVFEGLVGKDF